RTEWKQRESAAIRQWLQRARQGLGSIAAPTRRYDEVGAQLAGVHGAPGKIVLETRVADRQHRQDAVFIGLAAQVGNAVLGHVDIAQVARNRRMPIVPEDVRAHAAVAR